MCEACVSVSSQPSKRFVLAAARQRVGFPAGCGGGGESNQSNRTRNCDSRKTYTYQQMGPVGKASQPPGMLTPSKQNCGERVGSFDWLGKDNATWTKIAMFKVPRLHCQTVPVLEGSSVARNASDTAGLAGARNLPHRPSTGPRQACPFPYPQILPACSFLARIHGACFLYIDLGGQTIGKQRLYEVRRGPRPSERASSTDCSVQSTT